MGAVSRVINLSYEEALINQPTLFRVADGNGNTVRLSGGEQTLRTNLTSARRTLGGLRGALGARRTEDWRVEQLVITSWEGWGEETYLEWEEVTD